MDEVVVSASRLRPFDPRDGFGGVRAIVNIQAPAWWDARARKVRPFNAFGFDSAQADPNPDLLSVTVTKSLGQPCGAFSLNFAPRTISEDGYLWGDVIPPYSLVEIWMQRYPQDEQPVLVSLGLTDGDQYTGSFGQKDPHRTITVSGREVSCVLADQHTLYLPAGPEAVSPTVVSNDEWAQAGLPALPPIFQSAAQLLGIVAIDPELAEQGANPIQVIQRFLQMVTTGYRSGWNKQGLPLLQLRLGSDLKDILVFNAAAASLFDARAILPSSSQSVNSNVPLWSLMSTWSDPTYQELFPRSVVSADGQTAVEVVFRKKPFGGRLDAQGHFLGVPDASGSQFDATFVSDDDQNFQIRDEDVINASLRRGLTDAVNLYRVWPQTLFGNDPEEMAALLSPLIEASEQAPSDARRIGLRLMDVSDYYFKDVLTTDTLKQSKQREKLLWYWHRFEPLFRRGRYVTKLIPRANIGMRMLHTGEQDTEFYTTGVTHTISFGPEVVATSALDVMRGWPV